MPINKVKEFWKSVHAVTLFLNCFLKTLSNYLRVWVKFSKKKLVKNHFKWLLSTISGWKDEKIKNLECTLVLT